MTVNIDQKFMAYFNIGLQPFNLTDITVQLLCAAI